MQFGEDGDVIIIQQFAYSSYHNDFTLEFADGTVMHVRDEGSPFSSLF